MRDDFTNEIARVATEYCAADETQCQSNATR